MDCLLGQSHPRHLNVNQIGLPEAAVVYVTKAPPTGMKLLTLRDAEEIGIVAPGASVYVRPTPNGYYNGAPTVFEGPNPEPYAPPAPTPAVDEE